MLNFLLALAMLAQVAPPADAPDAPASETAESAEGAEPANPAEPPLEESDMTVEDPPEDVSGAMEVVVNSLLGMWEDFLRHLPLIVAAIVVLIVTAVLASLGTSITRRLLSRAKLRSSLKSLIRQLVYIAIWVTGLMVAAVVVFPGMTPSKVLTVLGLSSIAIGFAFRDIVENFIAGILILWRFPFDPGDFIECDGYTGQVERTTIRMTTIRQVDGQLVVLPNATLFKSPVTILTSQGQRRVTVICGVSYDTNVAEAREVIQKAVQSCSRLQSGKPIQIFAQEFGSSSINFEVTWWTGATPLEIRESRDEVVEAVKSALDKANIEIPFPYVTHTFKEPLEAKVLSKRIDEQS